MKVVLNPNLARSLFSERYEVQQPDIIKTFTDGIFYDKTVACDFTIPNLSVDKAWKLPVNCHIFSAELLAIKKLLNILTTWK